jgi:hypothetical protein
MPNESFIIRPAKVVGVYALKLKDNKVVGVALSPVCYQQREAGGQNDWFWRASIVSGHVAKLNNAVLVVHSAQLRT